MTHPTLGYDPAPGHPGAVRGVATALGAVASDAESITSRLHRLGIGTGDTTWRGPAATAFQLLLTEVGPDVVRLATAHRAAQDALLQYADALSQAQVTGCRAESDAARATIDRDQQSRSRERAADEAAQQDRQVWECRRQIAQSQATRLVWAADPAYQAELLRYETQTRGIQHRAESLADQARGQEDTARTAESAAAARIDAARLLGSQAQELRNTAAGRAVERLDTAGQSAPSRRHAVTRFLGRMDDALRHATANPEFGRWMQRLSDFGGLLLNVGSLVALLPIPGALAVGGGLMVAGAAFKAVSLAGTLIAFRYGNATWQDVAYRGVDLALSVVTARAGSTGPAAIKRALNYSGKGPVTVNAWKNVTAAPQVGRTVEGALTRTVHLRPQRYFQIATGIGTAGRIVGAGTGTVGRFGDLMSPDPNRPGWTELVVPIVSAGVGEVADVVGRPVIGGGLSGAIDLADSTIGALR